MPEQDTSKWGLNVDNMFYDWSANQKTKLVIESKDTHGVWLSIAGNSNIQEWYSWIPPEVAEAMGTMLLYAAQEWRQKHGTDTDPS